MKISICTLLVTLTIFLNSVESSPIPLRLPPNRPILPFMIVQPPPPPTQPIQRNWHNPRGPPQLAFREGRLQGVWFNGAYHHVADVVLPAPRPTNELLHGPFHLPDGAIVFNNQREPVGTLRGEEIHEMNGPGTIAPRPGYYVQYEGALIAVCRNDGFIKFRLVNHNEDNI